MPQEEKKKNILQRDVAIGGITAADRVTFAKHLAVMLTAGLSIIEALSIVVDSSKGKMKRVLKKVKLSLESGNSLAQALRDQKGEFSELFISAVDAGEKSGTLEQNLQYLAEQLDKEKKMNGKVRSAMAYPVIILIASTFLALGMAYFVLPQIVPLFSGLNVELPLTTRIIIKFSEIVREYGQWLFPGVIAGMVGIYTLLKQKFMRPITHMVMLHVPILKQVVLKSNLTRVSLTLGTLLKSGLDIEESLKITSGSADNFYFKRYLKKTVDKVVAGESLADVLARKEKLFPKLLVSMVQVGESAGSLDETLLYVASYYESEVENATKTLTTAIEPLLLLGIGMVVGTLALGIITPIYEVTGNLNR